MYQFYHKFFLNFDINNAKPNLILFDLILPGFSEHRREYHEFEYQDGQAKR